MKRFLIFFLVMAISASFAVAEDEGIGLSVGLEFGVGNVNKANDEEMYPYLMPMLIYENSFLDETLDIYAEVDYIFGFTKEPNEDGDEVNPQSIYVDLMIGYNLKLGGTSTLSFILENEFDEIIITPKYKEANVLTGIFTPAIKFNQEIKIGDLFVKIGAPITYIQYYKDADTEVGLDFTLGWNSSFGLGLEAKVCTLIVPSDDAGYKGIEATISYDYSFKNFTFYVKCEFAGIGVEGDGVSITPALGIKYNF